MTPEIQPGEFAIIDLIDDRTDDYEPYLVFVLSTTEEDHDEVVTAAIKEIGTGYDYVFPTSYLSRLSPLEQLAVAMIEGIDEI